MRPFAARVLAAIVLAVGAGFALRAEWATPGGSGSTCPPNMWNLDSIRRDPLAVSVLSDERRAVEGRSVRLVELTYLSGSRGGRPVVIGAALALPEADGPLPGIVLAHGDAWRAARWAVEYDVACLAIDRPGVGRSSGPADAFAEWYNCFPDPRQSWLYHYVRAALRGVTLLASRPEVDADRIGIAGSSRGGTMALLANGVDDRLRLALPHATAGHIVASARAGGWAGRIIEDLYGTSAPPEFEEFARWFDPARYASSQHGLVVWSVGAQDEYFLLRDIARTATDLPPETRLALLPNWDHRHFARGTGGAFVNTEATQRRSLAARRRAIEAALHDGRPLPAAPRLRALFDNGSVSVHGEADDSQPIHAVRLWVSDDAAWLFHEHLLEHVAGRYEGLLTAPSVAEVALFAEVEYVDGLCLTSAPVMGPGFQQRVREP